MQIEIAISRSYLQALGKLPKNIQKKANELFEKFKENPDAASINYEKIINTKDEKVRTVRVDQKYRAIVLHPENGNVYLFVHIDNHDEAMDWAKNKIFNINEFTSAFQVVDLKMVNDSEQKEHIIQSTLPVSGEYSDEELLSVGIPRIIIPALKMVFNMEDLISKIKDYVSEDIFEVLEFCVEKLPIEDIRTCFEGEAYKGQESMIEVIQKPINQEYIRVISNDEDIQSILKDPIDYWRIFIHPQQRKYVVGSNGHYKGSFQLKGAAGTGKTVVAMHRAKYLSENIYNGENDRILFTTYSTKLTKSVEHNLKNMCSIDVLRRIEVVNLHSFIAKYQKKYNLSFSIISEKDRYKLAEMAILKMDLSESYNARDILQEIDSVISFYQIMDLDSYLKVSRNGTFKKLGKNQRIEMWELLGEYYELLNESNQKEWWMVIRETVNMIKIKKTHPYRAIVVDEGQDFNMSEYRFLRALIPESENDLFIVGDIRQKIYSTQVNFSKCGINILGNRTRELTVNYRNTYEINQFSNVVIKNIEFRDLDSEVATGNKSNAIIIGDKPIITQFNTFEEEADYITSEIMKIVDDGVAYNEIAVIARTNSLVKTTMIYLENMQISCTSLEKVDQINPNKVYCGTMHGIKGFEFKVVFIVGANESMIPYRSHLSKLEYDREREQFLKSERSLLYVAVTRARDRLYVTGSPNLSEWVKNQITNY